MTPLFVGNWKLHKTPEEAAKTAYELKDLLSISLLEQADVAVAPPFIDIPAVAGVLDLSKIGIAAQNVFWENQGAYTGEISPRMLKSAGCSYVIIGHSERRQYFGETDDIVVRKVAAVVEEELTPILCVGETEDERMAEKTFLVLDKQLVNGLKGLRPADISNLVVAYEPVWAIGTGKTATRQQAEEVHVFLRNRLTEIVDSQFADTIRILYGGSVTPENIRELMNMPNINGALVGGASLTASSFSDIIREGV